MDWADSEANQTTDPGQPLDVLKGEYRFIGRLFGKSGPWIRNLLLRLLAVKGKIEPWRQQHFNSGRLHPRKLTTFFRRLRKIFSGPFRVLPDCRQYRATLTWKRLSD